MQQLSPTPSIGIVGILAVNALALLLLVAAVALTLLPEKRFPQWVFPLRGQWLLVFLLAGAVGLPLLAAWVLFRML